MPGDRDEQDAGRAAATRVARVRCIEMSAVRRPRSMRRGVKRRLSLSIRDCVSPPSAPRPPPPCARRLSLEARAPRRRRLTLAFIYARRPQGPLCDDLRRVPVVCVARGCVSLAYDGRSRKLYRLLGGPRGTAYADPTPNGNAAAQTVATGADCGQHVLVTPHRIWTLIQQVPSLWPAPTRSEPTSRPCHPAPAAPSRPWLF